VEALIDSMTQMMRVSFEEEREKSRRENDGGSVESEKEEGLPTYPEAVRAAERH
jgi:hypothetical protein